MTDLLRHPVHSGHLTVGALKRHRDRPVLFLGDTTLTGGELADRISQYIQAFEALGAGTGAAVGLLSLNRPEVLMIIGAGQTQRVLPDRHSLIEVQIDVGVGPAVSEIAAYRGIVYGQRAAAIAAQPMITNRLVGQRGTADGQDDIGEITGQPVLGGVVGPVGRRTLAGQPAQDRPGLRIAEIRVPDRHRAGHRHAEPRAEHIGPVPLTFQSGPVPGLQRQA